MDNQIAGLESLPAMKGKAMTTTTLSQNYPRSPQSHLGFIAFISAIRSRWEDYRLMRSLESVPYDVMKDVGFPAPEHKNEM